MAIGNNRTMEYEPEVESSSDEYVVIKEGGLDYRFSNNVHLAVGARITPGSTREREYCENLVLNGALASV